MSRSRTAELMAVQRGLESCHSPRDRLSIFGHSRGEGMVDKLAPMLKDAGFSDVEPIPTRHKNFAFIRAV